MKKRKTIRRCAFMSALLSLSFLSGCKPIANDYHIQVKPPIDGLLGTIYEKVTNSLYENGNEYYVKAYDTSNKNSWNAEPEFGGKFMMICSLLGGQYLDLAKDVVAAAKEAQREDGYLGCLQKGYELKNFSIWNQAFTILGLVSYYEATNDVSSLECAEKCADYIEYSLKKGLERGIKITNALNGGSQHISSIISFVRLYRATNNIKYLEFAEWLIKQAEEEGFPLINYDDFFSLKSLKGIEMLIVYMGIAEFVNEIKNLADYDSYYNVDELIDACIRFWEGISDTQVRNTGGMTSGEWFRKSGNKPANLSTSENVNENCVAVGWCEFSWTLFQFRQDARYLDAIEKTLFNHVLGAVSNDGSDFAYYQGNYGKKEFATSASMYKCCRMRGIHLISMLPHIYYHYDGEIITPTVYTSGNYETEDHLSIQCETNYPQNSDLKYIISNKTNKNKQLQLRIPSWSEEYIVTVNGEEQNLISKNGYINIEIPSGSSEIKLTLPMRLVYSEYDIKNEIYCDFKYGPLLIVHDRSNGTMIKDAYYNVLDGSPTLIENEKWNEWSKEKDGSYYLYQFSSGNLNLVDYASAGRANPKRDYFRTYIKVTMGSNEN